MYYPHNSGDFKQKHLFKIIFEFFSGVRAGEWILTFFGNGKKRLGDGVGRWKGGRGGRKKRGKEEQRKESGNR